MTPEDRDIIVSWDEMGSEDIPEGEGDQRTAKELLDLERRRQEAVVAGIIQDNDLKKEYSKKLYWAMMCWLVAIILVVLLQGFELWGFHLSGPAIVTLVGTTTANTIGLFVIVTKYIFRW